MYKIHSFSELQGRTISKIEGAEVGSDVIDFHCTDGTGWRLYHQQDCCESVCVEEIIGDLEDLKDLMVLRAEEVVSGGGKEPGWPEPAVTGMNESETWTFYRIYTLAGCVVFRWLGTSNGYYSESVTFEQIK